MHTVNLIMMWIGWFFTVLTVYIVVVARLRRKHPPRRRSAIVTPNPGAPDVHA